MTGFVFGGGGDGATLPALTNPATAQHILKDKQTLDGEGNIVTGIINSKAAQTYQMDNQQIVIPAGVYLAGDQKVNPPQIKEYSTTTGNVVAQQLTITLPTAFAVTRFSLCCYRPTIFARDGYDYLLLFAEKRPDANIISGSYDYSGESYGIGTGGLSIQQNEQQIVFTLDQGDGSFVFGGYYSVILSGY